MGHEDELGTQQTDPFGAAFRRIGSMRGIAEIGGHFDGVAIAGDGRL